MATAFLRTVIFYLLIMSGLRFMGKRQIGELEPSDLVLTMMVSDLATVPMQDFGIPLLNGVIPILTLLALSMLISQLSLSSLRFRDLACGSPTVLIDRGHVCQGAMRRNRFTIDELLEALRGQGYCDLNAVKFAILENSGKLSILPWPQEQPPTAKQLRRDVGDDVELPVVLVNDGRTLEKNLETCGKDQAWLLEQLKKHGLASPADAFLLTLAGEDTICCLPKEGAR